MLEEEIKMDNTEQAPVVQVTISKHSEHVAQGKKLAALNKERKDTLLKNKAEEVG